MRTIIAGSRSITDYAAVVAALAQCPWEITTVLSGGARGVDLLGEMWAQDNKVKLEVYPANWKAYGKLAGFARNVDMAQRAEALVAVWDGESNGTRHMIRTAEKHDLRIFVVSH